MAGYVFISNSVKPNPEEGASREAIKLTNVSKPCLEIALSMGYDVWFGTNRNNPEELECELPVHLFDSHTYRKITPCTDTRIAFKNMMAVLNKNDIEVIHCNTPIGGVIGRLCGKLKGVKKVIYTAHGFHFYKGAPLLNRTMIKWAEMFMAHWTDAIITMNQEDFEAAQMFKLRKGGRVYYTPGVGIDTEIYQNVEVDRDALRKSLGLKEEDIVCISMGDLIPRKNYGVAIEAVSKCANNVHYLICGRGPELENLQKIAKDIDVENRVHFLGFRTNVKELLKAADVFLFTTFQEGMPRSMMEAMASGLPCIASKIRGNVDLLEDGKGGYLFAVDDVEGIANGIQKIACNQELREEMGKSNLERIKAFDVQEVKKVIDRIYNEVLGRD